MSNAGFRAERQVRSPFTESLGSNSEGDDVSTGVDWTIDDGGGSGWSGDDDDLFSAASGAAAASAVSPLMAPMTGVASDEDRALSDLKRPAEPVERAAHPAKKPATTRGDLGPVGVSRRYSRFYEVGFLRALAECARRTGRGPLTASAAERSKIEQDALVRAKEMLKQGGSTALGPINGNDNPRLEESLILGTRGSDKSNNSAFRELQSKLMRDTLGRRTVRASMQRTAWTKIILHLSRPCTAKNARAIRRILGDLSIDHASFAGRLHSIPVDAVRSAVSHVSTWDDESICLAVLYGRITHDVASSSWSFDGRPATAGMAKYLTLLDEAATDFTELARKSQGIAGAAAPAAKTSASASSSAATAATHQSDIASSARAAAREAKIMQDRMWAAATEVMENVSACLSLSVVACMYA